MSDTMLVARWWPAVVGAVLLLMLLSGLVGTCQHEPNAELAQATRAAIEMARESQEANEAAYLWPGRLRLLTMVIGVTVPIGVAALIVHLVLRRRPEDLEVLQYLQRFGAGRDLLESSRSSGPGAPRDEAGGRLPASGESSPNELSPGTKGNDPPGRSV